MKKNSSTKDLALSSNERIYVKKNIESLFYFPTSSNFTSKNVKFYTFHSGFKKKHEDLLIVVFNLPVSVAAVYSNTSTPSAPIIWDKKNNKGLCRVLIVNAGNANAHTGLRGLKNIDIYAKKAASFFKCNLNEIMISSTGVIGEQLNPKLILNIFKEKNFYRSVNLLSAAKSIMTTDTYPKVVKKKIKINKKNVEIFGIAKGSGMIFPNMATMLSYIFIDANISKNILNKILKMHLDASFNSITVDGDTSTSDTVMLFSLLDKKEEKISNNQDINKISNSLKEIMSDLAFQVVSDGEGISKLIQVNVIGARTYVQASSVAISIANSPLVKTAIAGQDANWGRIIMAIGKADRNVDQNKIKLKFGNNLLATKGEMYKGMKIQKLDSYMKNKMIKINVDLGLGNFKRIIYSSDLTHEYIRINGDYRS